VGRKAVGVEKRRLELILAPKALGLTVREVCRRFGVSPTQFYEWRRRYLSEGLEGLSDRSSRPQTSPRRTAPEMELAICRLRVEHPNWGPRRIRAEIRRAGGDPPAKSTTGRVLVRNGLVTPKPRKRRQWLRFERARPNDLWQIDGKPVVLADAAEVWAINLLDDHARVLLSSRASVHLDGAAAWEAFEAASEGFGLPRELLSDNGLCFTGWNRGFVAQFERKLWTLGIRTIASTPRHPQTTGKLERFHRTLGEWLEEKGPIASLDELQRRLDAFRWHYNQERPHQGIDDLTPMERYVATPKAGPTPDESSRSVHRKVAVNGTVRYSGWLANVTREWAGLTVEVIERGGKVRILYGGELLTAFSTEQPKGYIGTGVRRGGRALPRRIHPA
jgi:transposase InsO family protein